MVHKKEEPKNENEGKELATKLRQQIVLGRTNSLIFLIRHGPHRKRRLKFFCCLYTEPLPSKDGGYTYRHRMMRGINTHTAEVGSGATIYIPSFIKIGSSIQRDDGRGLPRHTDRTEIA
jgi:hypothetical protein